MKKEKKKFKDTIFGKIVGKAGDMISDVPAIIGQVATGNYIGAVATLAGNLTASDHPESNNLLSELNLKMKKIELEFARVDLEEFKAGEENVSKRWVADMMSDSWLSKNVRPLGLTWVLVMTTAMMIMAWCDINTPVQVITMFGGLATTITGGYYVLRTVEKRNTRKYDK